MKRTERPIMISRLFVSALLGATALVAAQSTSALAATIYVDDDTCPSHGSGTPEDPYCRIEYALDAAVNGDEIIVRDGKGKKDGPQGYLKVDET